MDRRKRKSQAAIKQALLELIREKDFEEITIADITNLADLNRGTFYLHYEDKYQMIDKLESEFIVELQQIIVEELQDISSLNTLIRSRYNTFIMLFDLFKANHDLLEILLKTKGIGSLQNHLKGFIEVFLQEQTLLKKQVEENIPIELFISVIVSTILGTVQYSMEYKDEYTSEELTEGLVNIVINGPARAAGFINEGIINIDKILK